MAEGHDPRNGNSPEFPGFHQPPPPPGHQQQPPFGQPQQNQPQPTLQMEAVIIQLMQQLQHQQMVTNRLLQQQQAPSNPEAILDSLASNMKEFHYDLDNNCTFAAWYDRYDDLFANDARRIDDAAKVRLLLRRLGTSEHARYVSFILPSTPKDFDFATTVSKLKALFDTQESTVRKRFSTLTVSKTPTEDFISFGCRVNKMCVGFELSTMTEEQFKCLIFVCGLKSECDAEVRTRLLSKINDNAGVNLESLMAECQRMINLKQDTAMIETPATSQVQAIKGSQQHRKQSKSSTEAQSNNQPREEKEKKKHQSTDNNNKTPSTPCWNCGAMHYVKYCDYQDHRCEDCDELGHKEGYCISAKNCKKKTNCNQLSINVVRQPASSAHFQSKRRFVPVLLNGVAVRMQLDTASDISIVSKEVWDHIGRPPISSSSMEATCASGKQLVLKYEFVCSVAINDIVNTSRIFISNHSVNLLGADLINLFDLWSSPMDAYSSPAFSDPRSVSVNCVHFSQIYSSTPRHHWENTIQSSSKATAEPARIATVCQILAEPAPSRGAPYDSSGAKVFRWPVDSAGSSSFSSSN